MAKGDDIEERLIRFAVRVLKVCAALPDTPEGRHVRGQLIRSGTAPAPHYGEGRGAESTRDFIHKLKICLKELNESRVWLLIIKESEMLPADLIITNHPRVQRTLSYYQRQHQNRSRQQRH